MAGANPTSDDFEFEHLYGPWEPLTPGQVDEVFAGYDGAWWIAGGWAIEAFTGRARAHHDVDVVIWKSGIGELRREFGTRFHLWSAGGGMLRPLNDEFPELHEQSSQIWVRRDASAPWLMDVNVNEQRDGQWVFKRRPELAFPLEDVTWVAEEGIRYLSPEYVLAFKAAAARPQDDADLRATLPGLSGEARSWLRQTVEDLHPDHKWLNLL